MPKRKTKTFEERITRVFEDEATRGAACDVCKEDTITFQSESKEDTKRMIKSSPLNEQHRETYRQNFEFMLKDDIWNKTMGKNNLYICLECWERDFLTPKINKNTTKRQPNEFGFFHIIPEDMQLGNPVNVNADSFFSAVAEAKEEEANNAQHQKDVEMIGKHDMEHGFDDEY